VTRGQRLLVVLVLNLSLVVALVVVGISANSLGVLAEGGDYLLDSAGVAVALFASALARRPASARRPNGYPNAVNIAALVNGGWLLLLEGLVAVGAVERLSTGVQEVHGLPVLLASGAAAIVMTGGALVLGHDVDEDGEDDLSVRAVLLDTVADAAAASGVAAVGGVILVTGGWYWLDPVVALVIAAVVGWHALKLVTKAIGRLRAGRAPILPGRRNFGISPED
jgi:cobalt-zinc-cadmium efflux system protein